MSRKFQHEHAESNCHKRLQHWQHLRKDIKNGRKLRLLTLESGKPTVNPLGKTNSLGSGSLKRLQFPATTRKLRHFSSIKDRVSSRGSECKRRVSCIGINSGITHFISEVADSKDKEKKPPRG